MIHLGEGTIIRFKSGAAVVLLRRHPHNTWNVMFVSGTEEHPVGLVTTMSETLLILGDIFEFEKREEQNASD